MVSWFFSKFLYFLKSLNFKAYGFFRLISNCGIGFNFFFQISWLLKRFTYKAGWVELPQTSAHDKALYQIMVHFQGGGLRWFTCVLIYFMWILDHLIYLKMRRKSRYIFGILLSFRLLFIWLRSVLYCLTQS